MPFTSIDGAKKGKFMTTIDGVNLTLTQVNKLAEIFDALKREGKVKEPMAVAITQFKKLFKKQGNAFVKVDKKSYELPETVDIDGIEIFSSVGKPNGHEYTDADLDAMVSGFAETKDELKPYLKLGHDDEQKLAQNSGMPALGWVENLRRVGSKLIADFKKVPQKIYDLIKSGAYRRVSSEIFWNLSLKDKTHKRLLKAVALLGADTPACRDLNDIVSLYENDEIKNAEVHSYDIDFAGLNTATFDTNETATNSDNEHDAQIPEVKTMPTVEELTKQLEDKDKEVKQYQEEKEEAEKKAEEAEKKAEDAQAELDKKKDEETKTDVNALAESLIQDKHLLPRFKDAFTTVVYELRKGEVQKYKIGEDEKSFEDILVDIVKAYTIDIPTEEKSEVGDVVKDDNKAALAQKAHEYAEKHGVSYKDALINVSK